MYSFICEVLITFVNLFTKYYELFTSFLFSTNIMLEIHLKIYKKSVNSDTDFR